MTMSKEQFITRWRADKKRKAAVAIQYAQERKTRRLQEKKRRMYA
jgi:hypothetical protein